MKERKTRNSKIILKNIGNCNISNPRSTNHSSVFYIEYKTNGDAYLKQLSLENDLEEMRISNTRFSLFIKSRYWLR